MKTKITGEFIRLCALQINDFKVSEARAAEIARDVERVNNAALAIAAAGDFNDAPSDFTRALAQLQFAKPRR